MKMKRCCAVLLLLIIIFSFNGCKSNTDEFDGFTYEPASELKPFDSLEAFQDHLSTSQSDDDKYDLDALEKYYLPTAIPDEYQLYKINVGITDIAFNYLPKSYLASGKKPVNAELLGMNFTFISPRYEDSIESIYEQFDVNESEQNGRYYVHDSDLIFWEFDGTVLGLYLPKEIAESGYDPTEYCHAKVVYVK